MGVDSVSSDYKDAKQKKPEMTNQKLKKEFQLKQADLNKFHGSIGVNSIPNTIDRLNDIKIKNTEKSGIPKFMKSQAFDLRRTIQQKVNF